MEESPDERKKWKWRKLLQYFLQGLVVLAPIIITAWAVVSLFLYIDNILPNILDSVLPASFPHIPGLGFIVITVMIVLTGWISSSYIVGKIVDFFGHVLERTPGVRFIYTSVKDFLEAFAGEKRKFDRPVMVNVDANDVWRLGFVTGDSARRLGLEAHMIVYVPHSYAVSGIVYVVPAERVRYLNDVSSTEAMKFALSGGVAHIS